MGWFSKKKDWNVIAVIFEKKDVYRVNGNRAKGGDAEKARNGARNHERTIYWAVFDQKGSVLEGEAGPGARLVPPESLAQLKRDLPKLQTVRQILEKLEGGDSRISLALQWTGYPK